jgi:hypothetical protein
VCPGAKSAPSQVSERTQTMSEMAELPWDKNQDEYYEEWEIKELQQTAKFEKDQQKFLLIKSEKASGTVPVVPYCCGHELYFYF